MDRNRWIRLAAVVFLVLLLSVVLAACSSIPGATQSKPQIKIIAPSAGTQVQAGQEVSVQSMATDPNGVRKVELWVDQVLVRADELAAQNAGSAAAMAQVWKATTSGSHNLMIIAYNRGGVASEPTWVTVNVVSGPAEASTQISPQPTGGASPSNCKNSVQIVSDVTVPPKTVMAPGQVFVKTWRVRNAGNCTVSNHQLVAIKGETMGVNNQPVPDIPVGQESDISATMVAPNAPGEYQGVWQVSSPEGYGAGSLSCWIIVQGGGAPGPTPTTPILVGRSAAAVGTLAGTSWTLTSLGGQLPLAGSPITANFQEDGNVAGSAGCNRYNAAYEVSGDKITFRLVSSTLMACPGPVMAQEGAYLKALEQSATFKVDATQLTLFDTGGKALAAFAPQSMELAGTSWKVTFYNNGKHALVSVIIGTRLTADFAKDGRLSGSGGCNQYSADYKTAGKSITIGPALTTRMICAQPAGVMDQEAQYLAALQSAATYSIDGDKMDMRTADGATAAWLQRARATK